MKRKLKESLAMKTILGLIAAAGLVAVASMIWGARSQEEKPKSLPQSYVQATVRVEGLT